MKLPELKYEIEIPEGIEIKIDKTIISVKGPKGENSRIINHPNITITSKDNKITILTKNATKKEKTMMGTYRAHIQNLIKGVSEGFSYQVKVCSGHFPISVNLENNTLLINNFLGEKVPRQATVLEGVEAKIEGEIITLEGIDKEKVGQSSANIEKSTKVTGRDRRVFQDGCFIISKDGKSIV